MLWMNFGWTNPWGPGAPWEWKADVLEKRPDHLHHGRPNHALFFLENGCGKYFHPVKYRRLHDLRLTSKLTWSSKCLMRWFCFDSLKLWEKYPMTTTQLTYGILYHYTWNQYNLISSFMGLETISHCMPHQFPLACLVGCEERCHSLVASSHQRCRQREQGWGWMAPRRN